jgi:hypothetical protein
MAFPSAGQERNPAGFGAGETVISTIEIFNENSTKFQTKFTVNSFLTSSALHYMML